MIQKDLMRLLMFVSVVCYGAVFSVSASASRLSEVAASLQPGAWAEVSPMTGWNGGGILVPTEFGCSANDYITQYAQKAVWDPTTQRFLFLGHTHGSCYAGRFIIYTASTNSWSIGPWPPNVCQSGSASSPCFSHAYDHNAIDPLSGDVYYRHYNSTRFFRFRNGSWSTLPAPNMPSLQCCGALEFFPAMNRLIFIDGDWGMWAFNPANSTWTRLANTNAANVQAGLPNLPMSAYNNFALVNPVENVVLFGGGSNLYKMEASGAITTLRAPPVTLGVTDAVVSVDPVSGKYLVLSGTRMYQYDVRTDSWLQINTSPPATLRAMLGVGDGLVTTPVSSLGVVMYVKYDFGNSKVFLYKHSPSVVDTSAPAPPTQLTAN